jgi:hypothetical protein
MVGKNNQIHNRCPGSELTYLLIDLFFEVGHSQFPASKAERNITDEGIEKI